MYVYFNKIQSVLSCETYPQLFTLSQAKLIGLEFFNRWEKNIEDNEIFTLSYKYDKNLYQNSSLFQQQYDNDGIILYLNLENNNILSSDFKTSKLLKLKKNYNNNDSIYVYDFYESLTCINMLDNTIKIIDTNDNYFMKFIDPLKEDDIFDFDFNTDNISMKIDDDTDNILIKTYDNTDLNSINIINKNDTIVINSSINEEKLLDLTLYG